MLPVSNSRKRSRSSSLRASLRVPKRFMPFVSGEPSKLHHPLADATAATEEPLSFSDEDLVDLAPEEKAVATEETQEVLPESSLSTDRKWTRGIRAVVQLTKSIQPFLSPYLPGLVDHSHDFPPSVDTLTLRPLGLPQQKQQNMQQSIMTFRNLLLTNKSWFLPFHGRYPRVLP